MSRSLKSWAQRQRGRYLLRRSLNLAQQGNHSSAILSLTTALDCHPQTAMILVQRGLIYLQQEDWAAALADFDQAIALDPDNASAYGHRGLVRYGLNDEPGALADWARALSLNPREAIVRYNRGLVFAQQGDYKAALVDFDIAIDNNPLLAEAYLHRGKIKQALGDAVGAVKDWEIALCNDLRLNEAHQLLAQTQANCENLSLQDQLQDLLPEGIHVTSEHRGTLLTLMLHRPVGTPVNYFKLPNALRDRLVELQLPEVRRFRLLAKAGDSSLSEWDQTYGIYDKAPCPPARWRDAVATTLLLFPPLGILALVLASQVEPAYRRGDYPIAARASQAVRKLCLSSGAIMGIMLFGVASYGVYTYVDGEYPNPAAKTAMVERPETSEQERL
ncbi:MAG: tetratricopeptide repeat protein [Cyanobacteria bacterium P01_H01_bin.153]